MTCVYSAADKPAERSAFRQILLGLKMENVGDPTDWSAILTQAPIGRTDKLLVDWDLLPNELGVALAELRKVCPAALVIVLINLLDACQQVALCTGADMFISKGERPERVAERLRNAAPPAFIL